jgi:hypothetical protein
MLFYERCKYLTKGIITIKPIHNRHWIQSWKYTIYIRLNFGRNLDTVSYINTIERVALFDHKKASLIVRLIFIAIQFYPWHRVYTGCKWPVYSLFTPCIHPVYTLYTPCIHPVYTLFTACLHPVYGHIIPFFRHCSPNKACLIP